MGGGASKRLVVCKFLDAIDDLKIKILTLIFENSLYYIIFYNITDVTIKNKDMWSSYASYMKYVDNMFKFSDYQVYRYIMIKYKLFSPSILMF